MPALEYLRPGFLVRTFRYVEQQTVMIGHDMRGAWPLDNSESKSGSLDEAAPFMFNAGWGAADDFNAATFTLAHAHYRQSMASLRSAMDRLTIAAGFGAGKMRTASKGG